MTPHAPPLSAAERARVTLDDLLRRPGVLGALLVTRDGLPVMHAGASFGNVETFSAMQATALGAAEMALDGMQGARAMGIVIDLGERRVLSRGVTPDLVMVLMIDRDASWEDAFEGIAEAGRGLVG